MKIVTAISIGSLFALTASASVFTTIPLGTADPFAVLAGSTITNTGSSVINGSIGVSPGTAITGFPPGLVINGTSNSANAVALQAKTDLSTAFNNAAGQACASSLTGVDLGGLTLTPGVYCFASSAQLTGTLTLNAQGDPNAFFLFQIGSTLTTASNSSVVFTNGGEGDNLFFQVGSSATIGTGTAFNGNILAQTSITFNTGANLPCGRALALNGAVTLDTNNISIDTGSCEASATTSTAPEPSTAVLGSAVLLILFSVYFQRKRAAFSTK